MNNPNIQKFDELVGKLRERFPDLEFVENEDAPVERAYDLGEKNGEKVAVHLNLQNEDEFHLNIGEYFWCEWFPCDEGDVADQYYNSVEGFIEGRHRLVDFFRGDKCYKSQLQKNENGEWRPIANSMHVSAFTWPWVKKHTRITKYSESGSRGHC